MKKTAIFILALFLAAVMLCLLCGFSSRERVAQHDWDRMMLIERYKDYDVYVDTQTGAEYLVEKSTYCGITPVLNPDGTPVLAPNFDAREDRP